VCRAVDAKATSGGNRRRFQTYEDLDYEDPDYEDLDYDDDFGDVWDERFYDDY
jgi:hypothetical protein